MRALIVGMALLLGACGFEPLYAPTASGSGAAIGAVNVTEIGGKAGHVLKSELDRMFDPERGDSASAHTLRIQLREDVTRLGLRRDESATRAELRLTASYTLDSVDSATPIRGSLSTMVAYEIPQDSFAEIAAQDDARERAAETMAQRLRADLAIRLRQRRDSAATR